MGAGRKFGVAGAVAVGALAACGAAANRVAGVAFGRDNASFSRRARIAQPCGLPPFPVEEPAVRARMEANSLKAESLVSEWRASADRERVSIVVGNGSVHLAGSIYYADVPSRMWVVLAHSYRSAGKEMEKFALMYARRGFNVLNVDLRGHGESEGAMIGAGWLDGRDILEWVGYLTCRFGSEVSIVLHGQSMGAAAVLNASGWCRYPQVVGVVADSSYAFLRDAVLRLMRRTFIPPAEPLYALLRASVLLRCGYDLSGSDPVDSVAASRIPTLLIHGSNDDVVPSVDAANLYHACGAESKCLHIVPEAGHMASFFVDPEAYEDAVFGFFGKAGII